MRRKGVIILSGGMDSFTLLRELHYKGDEVFALSFNYGQRHSKELTSAGLACAELGVEHKVVGLHDLASLLGSSLTDYETNVPEGHYAEESMKSTVVPNRNMIMLSIAVGWAVHLKASFVYYAAHAGDHAIYPDCRPEFVAKLTEVTKISNYEPVIVVAPYLDLDKGDILMRGRDHAGLVEADYANTWTCYNGRAEACGKCGACQERLEGFAKIGWTDPVAYEDA